MEANRRDGQTSPLRYFKTSPEIIRLTVMLHVRFPLCPHNVEDLRHELGFAVSHETVRYGWSSFRPMFAADLSVRRVEAMGAHRH